MVYMKLKTVILSSAFSLLCLTISQATVIAFDPFSSDSGGYTPSSSILGQAPSINGFSGAWSGTAGVSISSSGLTAVPGAYTASGGSATQSGGSTATDVWYSFHMQTNHQNGTNTLRLINSSDSDLLLSFGQRLGGIQAKIHSAATYTPGVVQLNNGGSTTSDEAITVGATGTGLWTANTTYLMVVHLNIDRSGTSPEVMQFWKLSDASDFNPLTPFFTITKNILDSTNTGFTGIAIEGNTGGNTFDEVHVGTMSVDVVPEPSTTLLILAGATLFYSRRRR